MKFNTQVCTTREQSERLLAMGLNPETADIVQRKNGKCFHAWSLHRLWVINNDIYAELSVQDTYDCLIDEIEDKVRRRLINPELLKGNNV